MIGIALKLLRDELSDYLFRNKRPGDSLAKDDIILHNIALLESDNSGDLNNKVVITLVNTEEESTLKNKSNVLRTVNGIQYVEPAVFLNLYILPPSGRTYRTRMNLHSTDSRLLSSFSRPKRALR